MVGFTVRFLLHDGQELVYQDVGEILLTGDAYIVLGLDRARLADIKKQDVHFMLEERASDAKPA